MEDQPENLPQTLLHSIGNDYTKDALIELSESLLDSATETVMKSDAITKIPIVGWIAAAGKGVFEMRDRLYVRKLLRFLAETSDVSDEDKKRWQEKLDKDPKEAKRAGAVILDLIDKAIDSEKAAMIGKVVRAFMHEDDLLTDEMIAICEMIDKAYLDDLRALSRPDGESGKPWNDVNLEGIGIKKPIRAEDINKAIAALNSRLLKQMPVVREAPINDSEEPEVIESGFTDTGAKLRRILRDY
jgi:hypothetical protein